MGKIGPVVAVRVSWTNLLTYDCIWSGFEIVKLVMERDERDLLQQNSFWNCQHALMILSCVFFDHRIRTLKSFENKNLFEALENTSNFWFFVNVHLKSESIELFDSDYPLLRHSTCVLWSSSGASWTWVILGVVDSSKRRLRYKKSGFCKMGRL